MKTKKIVLVSLLALILTLSVVLVTFTGCNLLEEQQPEQDNILIDNGGMTMEDAIEENGIAICSFNIPVERYSDYGVLPIAESAKQLTATITPAEATDKTVDWVARWKNASSTWAKGKTISEYLTVSPTTDGSLTATVQCLQAFGEQIEIVVTARDKSGVSATCTVDYKQKVTFAGINLYPIYDDGSVRNNLKIYYDSSEAPSYTITSKYTLGVGTIPVEDTTVNVSYRLAGGIYTGGSTCNMSQQACIQSSCSHYFRSWTSTWQDFKSETVKFDKTWIYTMLYARNNAGVNALRTMLGNKEAIEIRVTCGDYEKIYKLTVSVENWSVLATGIGMSDSNIVFD